MARSRLVARWTWVWLFLSARSWHTPPTPLHCASGVGCGFRELAYTISSLAHGATGCCERPLWFAPQLVPGFVPGGVATVKAVRLAVANLDNAVHDTVE